MHLKKKRILFTLRNLKNLTKMRKLKKQERNLKLDALHMMNLNILKMIAKETKEDLIAMKVEKEDKLFLIDVIILDTLQGIA